MDPPDQHVSPNACPRRRTKLSLDSLPIDLLLDILEMIPTEDRVSVLSCCKNLYLLWSDRQMWTTCWSRFVSANQMLGVGDIVVDASAQTLRRRLTRFLRLKSSILARPDDVITLKARSIQSTRFVQGMELIPGGRWLILITVAFSWFTEPDPPFHVELWDIGTVTEGQEPVCVLDIPGITACAGTHATLDVDKSTIQVVVHFRFRDPEIGPSHTLHSFVILELDPKQPNPLTLIERRNIQLVFHTCGPFISQGDHMVASLTPKRQDWSNHLLFLNWRTDEWAVVPVHADRVNWGDLPSALLSLDGLEVILWTGFKSALIDTYSPGNRVVLKPRLHGSLRVVVITRMSRTHTSSVEKFPPFDQTSSPDEASPRTWAVSRPWVQGRPILLAIISQDEICIFPVSPETKSFSSTAFWMCRSPEISAFMGNWPWHGVARKMFTGSQDSESLILMREGLKAAVVTPALFVCHTLKPDGIDPGLSGSRYPFACLLAGVLGYVADEMFVVIGKFE